VETVTRPGAEAITFLPGDRDRSLKRGQNAAQALARELAALWEVPLLDILARPRPARPQRGLARDDRRRNVRGSFEARGASPARIVLVDDVYTTGATVGAAATELRRVGARVVDVVTFARAVRR
jgi:predicted amidophosphoribosyltransferase